MGRKRPVSVYVLITDNTLAESLLATLASKHDLALAALDSKSDISEANFVSNIEGTKRRLEVLLGADSYAPDVSSLAKAEVEITVFWGRNRTTDHDEARPAKRVVCDEPFRYRWRRFRNASS